MRLFVRPKFSTIPPQTKSLSCKTPGRHMPHRDLFHCVGYRTPYVKHNLQTITPLHCVWRHVLCEVGFHCQSREPNYLYRDLYRALLRPQNRTGFILLQIKSPGLLASRSSSLFHLRRSYSKLRPLIFTALETTRLTWSTWSMVTSLESLVFIDLT